MPEIVLAVALNTINPTLKTIYTLEVLSLFSLHLKMASVIDFLINVVMPNSYMIKQTTLKRGRLLIMNLWHLTFIAKYVYPGIDNNLGM